ncbi:MAG: orotidine 5'-phosphate decarboxylase [Zestosphaera tikiterensis]|uniref:Orotidine 5'-phosphate decarboxylase n=1 Tax=Zestosphaera tikiterensis TaxID=1973259 RepID=A0A2R7Y9C4_9CREN|nr:MAG: orotidine 5'-phosphate decarboxylase [Zestosphaera tikiterensis]
MLWWLRSKFYKLILHLFSGHLGKVIVALDPPEGVNPLDWVKQRYTSLKDLAEGFKVGLPLTLRVGLGKLNEVFRDYDGLLIADLKLADIGDIMVNVLEGLSKTKVNGVIAHAFVGYEDGVGKLALKSKELGIKLITVVSMSHKGSLEFMDKHLNELVELSIKAGVWGVVAPATRPDVVKRVRALAGDKLKILTPGVGFQGAPPGVGICAGADYEIVGRAITSAADPIKAFHDIVLKQEEAIKECVS